MTTTRKVQPRKRETQHDRIMFGRNPKVQPRKREIQVSLLWPLEGSRDRMYLFSFSWLQFLVHIRKTKLRGMQKCKGRTVEYLCTKPSNLPKILPQTIPKPSQTFPKPFQHRTQTPNRRKLKMQPRKQEKFFKIGFPR